MQPNQNWSNPLNTNLTCPTNKQTPFDSYYGIENNTEHVAFTKKAAEWLFNELAGNKQAPSFPIDPAAFTGPSTFCENSAQTYQFNDLCKIPDKATFTITGNIVINSFTDYAVTVQSINGGGAATITADFGNGQTLTKTIWVGVPQFSAFNFNPSGAGTCIAPIDFLIVSLPSLAVTSVFNGQTTSEIQSAANFEWVQENNLIMLNGTNNKRSICPMFEGFSSFKVRAKNSCGWSDWAEMPQFEITAPPTYNQRQANTNFYTVYPNPSKDIVNIDLRDANNQPEKNSIIFGELFDIMGLQRAKVKIIDNKATFSVQGLNKGIYILKIYLNNQVEAHQIAVE
ncbi:MAG: T9SS type A sorting domain-containing protein [Flavobacterium sp.]|nr:T9SS type A sorting domain-containing protein [Flavobacterium sp.]